MGMTGHSPWNTLTLYVQAVRRAGRDGFSMRLRLFLMLLFYLNIILMGFLLILFLTGTFHSGVKETRGLLENELVYRAQDVYKGFGDISVQGVALSGELSQSVERYLAGQDVATSELAGRPDLLEGLLAEELPHLTSALERVRASGAFLILDATVNPALPGAEDSRAGLYLKNMEPNIVSDTASNLRYMIGPMPVALGGGFNTLPQWRMEFDVSQADYFSTSLETARSQRTLPVSRLYRWSRATVLPGCAEKVMLLSVPLMASDGTVLGVCGFEVSQLLFKLSYAPDNSQYEYIFSMFSPIQSGTLAVDGSLFAGSYAAYPTDMTALPLDIREDAHAVNKYSQPGAGAYAGLHRVVALYPADSAYAGEAWALTLMMPERTLNQALSGRNRSLILGLAALLLISVAGAAFISWRYIRPVIKAFAQIKENGGQRATKTRIPEIDDLLDFLASQDETTSAHTGPVQEQSAMYQAFVRNIDTLSAAERAVFDLYIQEKHAQEIADILCLSINTIKTHNRRIYTKLNVTSRKELLVYIQMMEEAKRYEGA